MKRFTLIALLLGVLSMGAFAAIGKQPTTFKKLPKNVQNAFKKDLQPENIILVTCEKVAPKKYHYELHVSDGTKVLYNTEGQLLRARNKAGMNEVFVPKEINKYLKKNFPNATVTWYERTVARQVVELNDKMELIFSRSGKFIRIN